ncbi:MAG: hypothetical protein J0H64_02290 [Actinobacteria bacterium]|nr:hypothetical protein [Actinomycetota bacterium]
MTSSTNEPAGVPAEARARARRSRITWGAAAWIAILGAIGAVQIVRLQWFDAAAFLSVAVLLILDACARTARRRPAVSPRRLVVVRVACGLLVACGATGMLLPRHSFAMQALVVVAGAIALLTAWPSTGPDPNPWRPGAARLARTWAIIVIAGCLWELGEFILGRVLPSDAYALSDLVDPLLDAWPGRAVFLALWIAVGAFLLTRRTR